MLNDELLARLACGDLEAAEASRVRGLIASTPGADERYRRLITLLTQLNEARDSGKDFALPRERVLALQARLRPALKPESGSIASRAKELVATLLFDSSRTQPVGVRGVGTARLMHLACGEVRITLRTEQEPTTELQIITGEVSPRDRFRELVLRDPGGRADRSIPITQDGYFEVEILPGSYALAFVAPESETVVIDHIDL